MKHYSLINLVIVEQAFMIEIHPQLMYINWIIYPKIIRAVFIVLDDEAIPNK